MAKSLTMSALTMCAVAFLLASCGSSSDSSGPANLLAALGIEDEINDNFNVIRVNTGKDHILRFGEIENNAIAHALVQVYSYLTEVDTNQFGRFSEGYVKLSADAQAEIFSFLNETTPRTHIDLITLPSGKKLLEVRGDAPTDIPSGVFKYEGTNVFVVLGDRTENEFGSSKSTGTFRMEVNFTEGTGSIVAYSDRMRSSDNEEGLDGSHVSGDIKVNSEAGNYTGDDINVQNVSSQKNYKAIIYGSFHGKGAKGVTGLYFEDRGNDEDDEKSDPRFYGAIAGTGDAELEFSLARPFETVSEFNDKFNVVRVTTNEEQVLRYGAITDNDVKRAIVEVYSYLTEVDTNQYGRFSEGTVEIGSEEEAAIHSFLDGNTPKTHIDIITLPSGAKLLEVRGDIPTNIPSGVFRYEGTNIFVAVGTRAENRFGTSMSHGTFRLEANFEEGTGHIEATSANKSASGAKEGIDGSRLDGVLTVDAEAGTFSGDAIRVQNAASQLEFSAQIVGSFHGDAAKGVTGLYVEKRGEDEKDEDPRFYGAIAGVLDSESRTYSIVREFENGDNVVQIRTEDSRLLRYGDSAKNTPRRKIVIDYRNLENTSSNDFGSFNSGDAYVGLEGVGKVYSYTSNSGTGLYIDVITLTPDATDEDNFILNAATEDLMLEVGGDRNFTIPSGTFKYVGTNIFGVWNDRTANGWGSSTANGTFNLDVNFDDNTGTFSGMSPTRASAGTYQGLDGMEISGDIVVDSATGTFLGNKLNVKNSATNNDFSARINGTFHGDDANDVSGLYVEDNINPRFFGAFTGAKEVPPNTGGGNGN